MVSRTFIPKHQRSGMLAGRLVSGLPWERLSLLGVLLLAAFLNVFRLSQQGYGNAYYTAAVKSMVQNWHAFFFASFDAAGFVTVDKPPLGLWIQAASAKLFGVSGLSVILPQAVAGVLSVAVLYHLVRRTWGVVAGLLAALALALSPISVVTSRTNNLDSLLVLTVLLAAWAVVRATETGRLWWLLLGFGLVGLGFNIKMMQAFLVLPALGALYVLAARTGWWRRIVHLAAASAVLAVVSLSWAVVVDLTPADARPYVGSSETNSAIDLILGYNGLQRLLGRGGPGDGGAQPAGSAAQALAPPTEAVDGQGGAPPDQPTNGFYLYGGGPGGGGPGGGGETGEKGPFRLLSQQLGGQIGWLLPFAVIGFAGAVWLVRPRLSLDERAGSLVLWGVWFLTMVVFFSVAGFFHRYYLVMLAPAVAALCGIGAVALWRLYRGRGLGGWLLPAAIVATAAVQMHILGDYPDWRGRLAPVVLGLGGVLAVALVVARLRPSLRVLRSPALALTLGVPALLAAPAAWAGVSVWQDGGNTNLPAAGPSERGFGMPGGRGGPPGEADNAALIAYLERNRGDATFLVATSSTMEAAPIILATGEPVMAMGGFSGGDPILTVDELASLISEGAVRFFLAGGRGGPGDGNRVIQGGADQQMEPPESPADSVPAEGSSTGEPAPVVGPMGGGGSAMSWVTEHCTAVAAEAIGGDSNQLYDCAAAQG
jgi:4-amino-4-deoxy-L-arabinose transferase-like glycosyltransferase